MPMTETQLAPSAIQTGIAACFLIRETERKLLDLFAEGKLFGTVHTCIGQEWAAVAVAAPLEPGDLMVSNHRCHGHFIARTGKVGALVAEIMGRQTGVCGGLGGSQHLCDVERGFFSNGVQGGMMPVSAGLALSHKLRGTGNIAVVFIGDGTLGEGLVYETFNLASKWELPLLIVLENNGYAQSTPQAQTLAGEIGARAAAFGIKARHANVWNPEQLCAAAEECVSQVRRERRPVFLRIDCDRLMAHSKGDDDRDAAELEAYRQRDPLSAFLRDHPEEAEALRENARRAVEEAVEQAEKAPFSKRLELEPETAQPGEIRWQPTHLQGDDRLGARIRESLRRNLEADPRIFLLGEDIESPYGGAFKVTKGLSEEFPGRVRNTPISEAAVVGMANGLALGGFIPICEIMFGDFLTLAADQLINHTSKFQAMYNGQVKVPMVVRTPMGGRRGYGPTHSQSLEKHFLGIPQTQMLALNGRCDPGLIYDTLLATLDRPTIVIENKQLYTARLNAPAPEGFALEHNGEPFPTTRLRPLLKPVVTVFCYGGMLPIVEQAAATAFDEDEMAVEVICPVRIYPLDARPVIDSLRQTHRLLVAEEGIGFAAAGSELIAQIAEQAPGVLQRVARIASPPYPIPSSRPLEQEFLPGSGAILTALRELAQ